jgi:uncharacterized membrane protein (DUF2068 family)
LLALAFWFWQRWAFWLTILVEAAYLFFGVIAVTSNLLDWYTIPVEVVLPVVILVYLFADRNVRTSRKRLDHKEVCESNGRLLSQANNA